VPVRTTGSEPSSPTARPYGANLFGTRSTTASTSSRAGNSTAVQGHPAERYKDRIRIDDQDYPLVVKRVVRSPLSGERKADAVYYDEALEQWREVVDDRDRVNLARAVEAGRISIVEPADWPTG
jgi:hypothetical protein